MRSKKISVFDRSAEDCSVAAEAMRELFSRAGIKAVVNEFTDYEKFAYFLRDNHVDMAFVGITSPLDLEAARVVRQIDANCPLFMASRDGDYGLEGYRLHALDFIVKPVTVARLREAVSRVGQFEDIAGVAI